MLVISCFFFVVEKGYTQEKIILAFGDSLTAGYGLGPGEGFTDELERTLNILGINRHSNKCRRIRRYVFRWTFSH